MYILYVYICVYIYIFKIYICYVCVFYLGFFSKHSRFTGQPGKGEAIFLTPLHYFYPLHRHFAGRLVQRAHFCT